MRRLLAVLTGLSLLAVVPHASACVTLLNDLDGSCIESNCHFQCASPLQVSKVPLMPGYETNQQLGETVVEAVYRGSPAKAAGLQRGDVIVSIDGKSLSEASSVWQVAGPHTLLIDRNGQRYDRRLTAVPYERLIAALYSGPEVRNVSVKHPRRVPNMPFVSGLLVQQQGGRLLVTGVASGSPADKAGLRPGDALSSNLTASQLEAAQFRRTINVQVLSGAGTRRVNLTYAGISEVLDASAE